MNVRFWIGVALLAAFWLLGLSYFYPASAWAAMAVVVMAIPLLGKSNEDALRNDVLSGVGRKTDVVAVLLLLPALWLAVWPYRMAPLLVVAGLAFRLALGKRRWAAWLASGLLTAGGILLVQTIALELYASQTARSHDLPYPLPDALAALARLLGMDAAANGSTVAIHSIRQTHRLAATWELLVDPATLLFFVGGLTVLGTFSTTWRDLMRAVRTLSLVMLAWLPVRAGLLMAIYLHRVLRSDPDRPLHAMNHFFSPWVVSVLLVVPVLLAWRFVRFQRPHTSAESTSKIRNPKPEVQAPRSGVALPLSLFRLQLSAGLIALGVAIWMTAIYWNPVGARHEGRVMVVERHSQWEPTTKPYDTQWFAEPRLFGEASGYNYAAIYNYLGQYYEMSRLLNEDKIDDATLARCDVLVVKTPTERYSAEEVAAVVRFVKRGGGLLLVGDHTNFSRSSTVMNDITRPMGFIFRDDLLFAVGKFYDNEHYRPPLVPHPIVAQMPPTYFSVSCSIDPGQSHGRAAISNTGLWSMGPDYHAENFHPIPQHCPEMRYGAFVQVWAAWYGHGRAVAFTDSTIFSNFCTFQPGHAELMLGMVEWLNHANSRIDPRPWLLAIGLFVFGGAALVLARHGPLWNRVPSITDGCHMELDWQRGWLVLLAAGTCGWALGGLVSGAANRWTMPTPARVRPQPRVVIDRTTSDVPLAKGMYPRGKDHGYGMLEASIPRLGCHTVRKRGDNAFSGDVLVVICPSKAASDGHWNERLVEYVRGGGRLLLIDSPEDKHSQANAMLRPFGISLRADKVWAGDLVTAGQTAPVHVPAACEVLGGQAIAALPNGPVAAAASFGKGLVVALGFGSQWSDAATGFGENWMIEPDTAAKARYKILFGLLRPLLDGKLPATLPHHKPLKDLPLKESGIDGT
ncbi:MAG: GldG family protein [Planctomycetaceae bacterium]|nr:GldG family protein [Planctomycetaceae bacterium]